MPKPIEDEDTFENGILRDGRSVRVPMWAMDSLQRAIGANAAMRQPLRFADGTGDAVGHRPGFIVADGNGRAACAAAYWESVRELQDAWRTPGSNQGPVAAPMSAADAVRTDLGTLLARLNDARQSAYAAYVDELTNAWRRP